MKKIGYTLGVKRIAVLILVLGLVFSLGLNKLQASETQEDEFSPLEWDTYVTISPKNQTKIGVSADVEWTTNHSGGNGIYNITFYYGDGRQSTSKNYQSTRRIWRHSFTLGNYETEVTFHQQAVISSTGMPGEDTATTTVRRFK